MLLRKPPELSRRERLCVDAVLGIYYGVILFAEVYYPDFWIGLWYAYNAWQEAIVRAFYRHFPRNLEFAYGVLVFAALGSAFICLTLLCIRLRQPGTPSLRATWWMMLIHAALTVSFYLPFSFRFLPVYVVGLSMVTLAIIGLRATNARERAEAADG
jgi:hypothetical protein